MAAPHAVSLPQTGHAHLLGLRGAGLRSLAAYLQAAGWRVSGCDPAFRSAELAVLAEQGVQADPAHHPNHITGDVNLVVRSLAVPDDHPEVQTAQRRGIPCLSYAEMLGRLSQQRPTFGIAGTHGKTTTCRLLHHLLTAAKYSAGCVCGGRLQGESAYGSAGNLPDSPLILECCEFRGSFLHPQLEMAALLNVEPDHFDCYPDETKLVTAFAKFCQQIPARGTLVVNGDSPLACRAAQAARCHLQLFSTRRAPATENQFPRAASVCWFSIDNIAASSTGTSWTVHSETTHAAEGDDGSHGPGFSIEMPVWGGHQLQNATAAVLLGRTCGLEHERIQCGLRTFPGLERRFEVIAQRGASTLISDYAHHPTEIAATIQAARQRFPNARIEIAFQPHQVQRTRRLLHEFAATLAQVDSTLVLPVFAAREQTDRQCVDVSADLVEQIHHAGGAAQPLATLDQLRSVIDDTLLTSHTQQERVLLILGAGDIERTLYGLSRTICRHHTDG